MIQILILENKIVNAKQINFSKFLFLKKCIKCVQFIAENAIFVNKNNS